MGLFHSPVFTLKTVRKVIPHRSDSTIEDWISKRIVACRQAEGTGHAHEFDKEQLLHVTTVDAMSALGLLAKRYDGENFFDREHGTGNVIEEFYYPNDKDTAKRFPRFRSPLNAIEYYRIHEGNVVVVVDVMRTRPHLDANLQPVEKSISTMRKAKVGQIYYWVTYFPDDPDILDAELKTWRSGTAVGKSSTMSFISVTLLKERLERELGVLW